MVKLYKIEKDSQPRVIKQSGFDDEVFDMETFIKNNLSIIGEYQFLTKQPTIGTTGKRPDILAIDENGRLVIIELKKDFTSTEILEQIIEYFDTLKNQPDTIRKYYLEAKENLGDTELDTNLPPKVVVIAPEIDDKLISRMTNILTFEAEGIEVNRFQENNETFVIVNHKEHQEQKIKESTSRGEYSYETFAKRNIPEKIINKLDKFVKILEDFWEEENLNVKKKFNKKYIAFKHESSNVCSLRPYKDSISFELMIRDKKTKLNSQIKWDWYVPKNFFYHDYYEGEEFDIHKIKDVLKLSYELN